MKKFLMILIAIFIASSYTVSAQENPSGNRNGENQGGQRIQQTPEQRAERLAKQLDLTDAQKLQVQELYIKQAAEREKMMKTNQETKTTLNQEERRAQLNASRKAWDTELETIIGKEKFEKMQAERNERMRQGQGNRPRGNGQNPTE